MNWLKLLKHHIKVATYGHGTYGVDGINWDDKEQQFPWYDPYGRKKKSPNQMRPNMNQVGEEGKDGPQTGGGGQPDYERWDGTGTETNVMDLPQEDDGAKADSSHMYDSPQYFGESAGENLDSQRPNSPLGLHDRVMRKAKEPELDNRSGRLPNGAGFDPVHEISRKRRLNNKQSPMQRVWKSQS